MSEENKIINDESTQADGVQAGGEQNVDNENHNASSEGHVAAADNDADSANGLDTQTQADDAVDDDDKTLDELPLPDDEAENEGGNIPAWLVEKRKRHKKQKEKLAQEKAALEEEKRRIAEEKAELERILSPFREQNDPNRPARENFSNEEDYIESVIEYKQKKKEQDQKQKLYQKQVTEQIERRKQKVANIIEKGREKYGEDFEEVIEPLLDASFPYNPGLAGALEDSNYEVEIVNFLGKNYSHALKLAKMSPAKAAKEIAKLEIRFEERKKKNSSKAPAPPSRLQTVSAPQNHLDPAKMDPKTYAQWREAQRKAAK